MPTSLTDSSKTLGAIADKALKARVGPTAGTRFAAARAGDIRDSYADVSKAGKLIGYRPQISVEEGLKRTIDWYRNAELQIA